MSADATVVEVTETSEDLTVVSVEATEVTMEVAGVPYPVSTEGGADLSDETPQALGTAAAGDGTAASRDDHVHAMPTAAQVGADPAGTAASAVSAHTGDATDAHAASAITNTPAGTIAATTVQAAIDELDTEKVPTSRTIAGLDLSTNRSVADLAGTWTGSGDYLKSDGTKGTPSGGSGVSMLRGRDGTSMWHPPLGFSATGNSNQTGAAAQAAYWLLCYTQSAAQIALHLTCATGESGAFARLSLWTCDTVNVKPDTFIEDVGTVAGTSTADRYITSVSTSVSGFFFVGVWHSNHSSVRWRRNTFDVANDSPFGTQAWGGGQYNYAWSASGLDYSSAWPNTLPTLSMARSASVTANAGIFWRAL